MQPILQQLGNSDELIIQAMVKAIENKAQKDREMTSEVSIKNGRRCRPICFGFLVLLIIVVVFSILIQLHVF